MVPTHPKYIPYAPLSPESNPWLINKIAQSAYPAQVCDEALGCRTNWSASEIPPSATKRKRIVDSSERKLRDLGGTHAEFKRPHSQQNNVVLPLDPSKSMEIGSEKRQKKNTPASLGPSVARELIRDGLRTQGKHVTNETLVQPQIFVEHNESRNESYENRSSLKAPALIRPYKHPVLLHSGYWQELADPLGNIYYWNCSSGFTQWPKPEGFEEALQFIQSPFHASLMGQMPKSKTHTSRQSQFLDPVAAPFQPRPLHTVDSNVSTNSCYKQSPMKPQNYNTFLASYPTGKVTVDYSQPSSAQMNQLTDIKSDSISAALEISLHPLGEDNLAPTTAKNQRPQEGGFSPINYAYAQNNGRPEDNVNHDSNGNIDASIHAEQTDVRQLSSRIQCISLFSQNPTTQTRKMSTKTPPPQKAPSSPKADRSKSPTQPIMFRPPPYPTPMYTATTLERTVRLPRPKRLLVILDLNGTLLHRPKKSTAITKRPGLEEFLDYLFRQHSVMVWTSCQPSNMAAINKQIFSPEQLKLLVAKWARDTLGLSKTEYREKAQVYKRLDTVWANEEIQGSHPDYSEGHRFDQRNTVLIDDSVLKASANPQNLIEIPEYIKNNEEHESKHIVLFGVLAYLRAASIYNNVSAFIRNNPFTLGEESTRVG